MRKILKSKNIIYLMATFLLIGLLQGCSKKSVEINKEGSTESQEISFQNLNPEEAKKRLDSEDEIILLDVRTKEEYETGHIKDSKLLPLDNLEDEAEDKLKDKEATIFVYCRSGNRSVTASNILVKLGYKNVYNIGGINNWPYEIEK